MASSNSQNDMKCVEVAQFGNETFGAGIYRFPAVHIIARKKRHSSEHSELRMFYGPSAVMVSSL